MAFLIPIEGTEQAGSEGGRGSGSWRESCHVYASATKSPAQCFL